MPTLAGAEHHFVDVRGARLHVAELGDPAGSPVLLLHGWPQHWWSWHLLMPLLAVCHRVLAMDLRGFGWSEATPRGYRKKELAEDVVGVLDALGIDRVSLVGHDWGGIVGFIVCLDHPDRVERFVPMNTDRVWPTLSRKGIPKQLVAMTYQGALASPVLGRRMNASPGLVGKVVDAHLDRRRRCRRVRRAVRTALRRSRPRACRVADLPHLPALRVPRPGARTVPRQAAEHSDAPAARLEGSVLHARDVHGHHRALRRRVHRGPPAGAHFPAEECPQAVAEHLRAFLSPAG